MVFTNPVTYLKANYLLCSYKLRMYIYFYSLKTLKCFITSASFRPLLLGKVKLWWIKYLKLLCAHKAVLFRSDHNIVHNT